MKEVGAGSGISEMKSSETGSFKEIKPDKDISGKEAADSLDSAIGEIKESEAGFYTDYIDRFRATPREDSPNGSWKGERAESKFIPNQETEQGQKAIEVLKANDLDGIEYHNGEPDFSGCAESTVRIDDMTADRASNFAQADIKCAEQWSSENKDGKNDWSARDVSNYRHENRFSWHERCDTQTMDLVSMDVHTFFKHSGGVAECKARDNIGGGFDE